MSGIASLIEVHVIVDAHLYTEIDKDGQYSGEASKIVVFCFAEFINNLALFLERVRFYCVMVSSADC